MTESGTSTCGGIAGEVADGVQDLLRREILRHGDEFGDGFTRPVGVLELVDCEKNDVYAEARDLLHKELALFVGADAENGRLLLLIGHAGSPVVTTVMNLLLQI